MTTNPKIDECLALCNGGQDNIQYDPLHGDLSDPAVAARVHADHERGLVYLQGTSEAITKGEGEYADDLLIIIYKDGWCLFYRDPDGLSEPLWGRDWCGGALHSEWSSLVGEAYSL